MHHPRLSKNDPPADVVLLLEGTYPMVQGGVAGWVEQLIKGLPDWRFAVVFIGSRKEDYTEIKYDIPENLVHLEFHYLMDGYDHEVFSGPRRRGCPAAFARSRELHEQLRNEGAHAGDVLGDVVRLVGAGGALSRDNFLHEKLSWDEIVRNYEANCSESSFLDYFWTIRNIHLPVFTLAEIAGQLPRGRCFHAASTGYAGFLGAMAHHLTGTPLLVSEHGIYTKERHIDLLEADWIHTPKDPLSHGFSADTGYLRRLWIRFFRSLGSMTYGAAESVTTLYEGNQQRQIRDGADPEKTCLIPNGIRLERFRPLREMTAANKRPVIVLLGRVTPIKDIKTFLRAVKHLLYRVPEAEAWVVGPDGEDPGYSRECHDLADQLMLGDRLRFLGYQRTDDILPQARLVVLTSISEAQPLVVLESLASGIPVVTTDVGACREMVLGNGNAEQAAGRIVPIANPEATADAMAELLLSDSSWQQAREVGIKRVEAQYSEALMLGRYEALYRDGARQNTTATGFAQEGKK